MSEDRSAVRLDMAAGLSKAWVLSHGPASGTKRGESGLIAPRESRAFGLV